MIGPAVIAQQLPGKDHIVGGHRHAVGKARRRIEGESDVAARVVGLDRARQQAVEGERLVIATRHQAFEDVAADRLGGETLDDERIEAVEGAEHALHHAAALRRIGIDIVGRGKPVGHRRSPMHGDGVGRLRPSRRGLAGKRERARTGQAACPRRQGRSASASDASVRTPFGAPTRGDLTELPCGLAATQPSLEALSPG